jgi:hypothetical protein
MVVVAAGRKLHFANYSVLEPSTANGVFQIQDLKNGNSVTSRL